MRNVGIGLNAFFFLSCAAPSHAGALPQISAEVLVQQKTGWLMDCAPVEEPVAKSRQVFYRFRDKEHFQVTEAYYVDAQCKDSAYLVSYEGSLQYAQDKAGKASLNLTYDAVTTTLHTLEAEANFNATKRCGAADWEVGSTKEVSGTCAYPQAQSSETKSVALVDGALKVSANASGPVSRKPASDDFLILKPAPANCGF